MTLRSSKNTGARSRFEHLDSNKFSKTLILPHKSHTSHKYRCMNDGFFFNQRADQNNGPRRTAFCVESDFVKNTRFATAKEQFLYLDNTLSNKVLRTTAKMIHELFPNMIKVIKILRARRMIRLPPERYDLNRPLV